jgi:23S rRNA pseudouridine2605 synthase
LNKYIAASGICSRREADELISAGLITLNGKSITELGTKVKPGDEVRFNGKRIRNERKMYVLLNKPKDYVTTTQDPRERKTVMQLVKNACPERIYPVGRLDRQTTGVLLFTNDGDLAKKLTHPGYNKKKIYHVFLDRSFSGGDMNKLAAGITLEDGFIQPDALSYVQPENKKEIGLEIHSGRNRIVRRMFEHLGYKVTKLDRVYFAGLTKKNLPRGKWRLLTDKEVNRLKMNAYE